jgi:hypothetical protein
MNARNAMEILRLLIQETIRKIGNKWAVYPKKGGKRLGTHDTEAAAKRQLAAIEISKSGKRRS